MNSLIRPPRGANIMKVCIIIRAEHAHTWTYIYMTHTWNGIQPTLTGCRQIIL